MPEILTKDPDDDNDVEQINLRYLRSIPGLCKCGHAKIEHYDSHEFCMALEDCDCEKYEPLKED